MNCWEQILSTFPCFEGGEPPTIKKELRNRLGKLKKEQCKQIAAAISFNYQVGIDLEDFIECELSYFDAKKNINEVLDAVDRWKQDLPMTKKQMSIILQHSQKTLDTYIQMGMPSEQLVDGGKITFYPKEVKEWLDGTNLRQQ